MYWLSVDFWCYCDAGYIEDPLTGVCDVMLCDDTFCMHGTSCASDQLSCDCSPGVSGDHCETGVSNFDWSYAQVLICILVLRSFQCEFESSSLKNAKCQIFMDKNLFMMTYACCVISSLVAVDHCHGVDCSGHGHCRVIDGASYHCDCYDGWRGQQCSLQLCLDDVTCFNGGSCTYVLNFMTYSMYMYERVHDVTCFNGVRLTWKPVLY